MTDTPMKTVVDLSKPKGERETTIPMTAEEIAEMDVIAAQAAEEKAAREAAEAQRAADAQAGRDALVALGLTEAQINALLGA